MVGRVGLGQLEVTHVQLWSVVLCVILSSHTAMIKSRATCVCVLSKFFVYYLHVRTAPVSETNTAVVGVDLRCRNDELTTTGKYELGRISRLVDQQQQQQCSDGDGTAAVQRDFNQVNVSQSLSVCTVC